MAASTAGVKHMLDTAVGSPTLWIAFIGFVILMLTLDLGVFNRKSHVLSTKEALVWSVVWVLLALAFNGYIWFQFGPDRGMQFLSGYLIEKSLSVDNIFVFVVIFSGLAIPAMYQHRILFWGILSALILRAIMIFAGTTLLARFHWLIYLFGAFLVLTGIKLYRDRNGRPQLGDSVILRLVRRLVPTTGNFHGDKFLTREKGKLVATPLLLALILVEATDVVFAIDSIPAIFAVTSDPYIVFTSNIFAILGLRSLYFLLADLVERFVYLKTGLAAILVFVGLKMSLVDFYKIPTPVSLGAIFGILLISIVASLLATRSGGSAIEDKAELA